MKKYIVIALTLVLTAALFAGCRRMDDTGNTSAPTVMPTVELPTRESTETPTAGPTAGPTEPSTMPSVDTTPMDTESTSGSDATMMPEGTDMGTNPAGRRIPGGR